MVSCCYKFLRRERNICVSTTCFGVEQEEERERMTNKKKQKLGGKPTLKRKRTKFKKMAQLAGYCTIHDNSRQTDLSISFYP
jgi:hypothetical protein